MQKSTYTGSVARLRPYAAPMLAVVVAFFVDQATKQLARELVTGVGPFPHLITIVHHHNAGLVANLPVPLPIITLMTVVVLALVFWMLRTAVRRDNPWGACALGVLVGGALGNFWDRLTLGYVFDWILLFGRSAVNIADLSILLGALFYAGSARRATRSTDGSTS